MNYEGLLIEFINGDYESLEDFCKKMNCSYRRVRESFTRIREINPELYKRYIEKQNKIQEKINQEKELVSKQVLERIKNGIEEDGEIRPFNLLDYYKMTKIPLGEMFSIIQRKYRNQFKIFYKFYRKYVGTKLLNKGSIREILNCRETINVEFDEKGNVIKGSGYTIKEEDKLFVLAQLEENGIPLYDTVYLIALEEYLRKTKNIIRRRKNK